jgi:hypothetical protein
LKQSVDEMIVDKTVVDKVLFGKMVVDKAKDQQNTETITRQSFKIVPGGRNSKSSLKRRFKFVFSSKFGNVEWVKESSSQY